MDQWIHQGVATTRPQVLQSRIPVWKTSHFIFLTSLRTRSMLGRAMLSSLCEKIERRIKWKSRLQTTARG